MLTKILSAAHFGLESVPIEVEVNINKKGFPSFQIIGLPNKAIDEAKERVKTALQNSGCEFPQAKIVVNLAPADIPKEGSAYDLPIAVGVLNALESAPLPEGKSLFYGELSLDGTLRHTKGTFLLALAAKDWGVKNLFIPKASSAEASVIKGINVYPVDSLKELLLHLNKAKPLKPKKPPTEKQIEANQAVDFDFSEIIGQEQVKRALEIAAAGGHNVIMQGPPGSGKTMLARALAGILPPLSDDESLEVTKIYSLTGNIPPGASLIYTRPFRASHHTVSRIGLIGGGSNPHPGEISLAHNGVLFLDEFPEFTRGTLEALRQPLEDGEVSIVRAAGSMKFPCSFMLVAAANPCPCGFLGDTKRACKCSPRQIMNYNNKLSGPLLDRIDIHINVPTVEVEKLIPLTKTSAAKSASGGRYEKSENIAKRVENARAIQSKRFKNLGLHSNAQMKNKHIKSHVKITPGALNILKQAVNTYNLSARTYFRLIKVSQTIADLEGLKKIEEPHTAEALQYRIRVEN